MLVSVGEVKQVKFGDSQPAWDPVYIVRLGTMKCNGDVQRCTMTTYPAQTMGKASVIIQYEILPYTGRQPDLNSRNGTVEDEASHLVGAFAPPDP